MSHDAATSQRGEKPGLFATLDMAIAQTGIKGIDADQLYALSAWSIKQGRRFPWYFKQEQTILTTEGGRDQVILSIAGAALALMASGESDVAAACYRAGIDWRSDLRRQWGDLQKQREYWQNPVTFTEAKPQTFLGSTEDWITEHSVELAGPVPEFDPENIKDPRLAALWASVTDKQRELLVELAAGTPARAAAELFGVSHGAVEDRMRGIKRKARAIGPAA